MNNENKTPLDDLKVDVGNLYREEQFTDLKVASIKMLTPVNSDGTRDLSRTITFIGQTQILSQMGPLPVHCPIEADSLDQAIAKFPEAVKIAVDEMMEEILEMQRREASKIVMPGAGPAPNIMGR